MMIKDMPFIIVCFPKKVATNFDIALVRVKPGREIPAHTHENEDQAYIVLEGRGILRLGGEEQELSEKMIVHIPPHTEHSVRNSGKQKDVNIARKWAAENLPEILGL